MVQMRINQVDWPIIIPDYQIFYLAPVWLDRIAVWLFVWLQTGMPGNSQRF
jgi:hypothetical protein